MRKQFWQTFIIFALVTMAIPASRAPLLVHAQDGELLMDYPPNQDYGQQGDFIAKRAVDAGRTAIINTIGPALLVLPESPGSSDAHVTLRNWDSAWDISNPLDPEFVRYINCYEGTCRNGQAIHAHATFTNFWNGDAYLWSNNYWQLGNSHRYDPATGDTVPESPPWQYTIGRLYAPFIVQDLWSYSAPFENMTTIYYPGVPGDDWRGRPIATWDHLGDTGVTGFFSFIGDLMIVSADQASTGMAIYSMNGWKDGIEGSFTPQLISVYQPTLQEPDGTTIGLGGYWVEPYGTNKMVWAARQSNSVGRNYPAMYVVDFTDPRSPELTCELYFNQDTSDPADGDNMTMPMYVNFQDNYAYVDHMKVDIPACETIYAAGKATDPDYIIGPSEISQIAYRFPTSQNYCDGSQYFRPLGQIGIFGGIDRYGSESIITYTGPTIPEGSYSSGIYAAYNFGPNRVLSGNTDRQIGDVIGGNRTITNVEIDERMNYQGMCFFITSDEPDITPPFVSGHRPLANETNVSVDTFISLHIPETMRTETLVNAFQLTRLDNGEAVPFQHRLSHTGTVTLWPADDLAEDTNYRVNVAGIRDYMGNEMAPYSFTFSTGNEVAEPMPTIDPTSTLEVPTSTPELPTSTPTLVPAETPTATLEIEPTNTPLPIETATPAPTETLVPTSSPTSAPTPLVTGWIDCAGEEQTCTVPESADPSTTVVRYGISGRYYYRENVSGSIVCSNNVFGDPVVGEVKRCEYWSGSVAPDFTGEPYYPKQSSQLSCRSESDSDNLWVVNPDNDSIAIVDTMSEPGSQHVVVKSLRETYLNYRHPTSITSIGESYAVTFRDDDKVVFIDSSSAHPIFAIDTGHGTQPIASVSDDDRLFVALFGSGEVIEIDPANRMIGNRLEVGPMPRAMALHDKRLLVTRFISPKTHGEVYDIDTSFGLTLTRTIVVNKVLVNDGLDHGAGVPNFLSSIVTNSDGTEAYITAIKANIDRGTSSTSTGVALDDDNTIRPMMIRLDLINDRDANVEPNTPDGTFDFDNAADPAGVTYLADGESRVIAFQGDNLVMAHNERLNTFTQFASGFAPQSMCTTLRALYVKNFTGRSVSAIDVSGYMINGDRNPNILTFSTVNNEKLTMKELAGLREFYHSSIPEMGAEGYMSCASCHADGGQDGQVWDMTSLGEGLRNTIGLNGSGGTRFGNLHWSANFDEVQDFELQIEELNGGDGLVPEKTFNGQSPLELVMTGRSDELDALATYVSSLGKESVKRSPYRTYTGALTAAALRGQQIFADQGCSDCHAGSAFRDGQRHDVGTIKATSGNRLGGALTNIRTPTLIELWESAPYFHDGSAATLNDVFDVGLHQHTFSGTEEADLIEFLLSIDQDLFIEDGVEFPDFE